MKIKKLLEGQTCPMPEQKTNNWEEEFVEKGADLEHERWCGWQKYLHSICYETKGIGGEPTGDLQIPVTSVKHWERQIKTKYKDLTEIEKESDRKEVRKYIPLIKELLADQRKEIEEDVKKQIINISKENILEKNILDTCFNDGKITGFELAIDIIKKYE